MKKAPPIPEDLIPEIIAQTILQELVQVTEFRVADQPRLIAYLVQHAEEIAAANERFRRKLRGKLGREWLYAFMRHWLAAELKRTQPAVFNRLPPRYAMGDPDTRRRPTPSRPYLMNTSG